MPSSRDTLSRDLLTNSDIISSLDELLNRLGDNPSRIDEFTHAVPWDCNIHDSVMVNSQPANFILLSVDGKSLLKLKGTGEMG